jgi:3'-5' exonuclease
MLNSILDITKILFFDIETVPGTPQYSDLDERWQDLWHIKAGQILKKPKEEVTDEDAISVYDRAGIYAEFGKIVCISVGIFIKDKATGELTTRFKSYASADEAELLRGFSEMLTKSFNDPDRQFLCGHNIKEFDVPYICRRMLIHQMPFPKMFEIEGKKPWETKHLLDTLELWKFGDYKNYTSIKLLTAVFDIPSPKDDIDGSQVGRVFYEEGDVERIARYCEKDVVAVMQLILRFKRMPMRLTIDGKVISEND